MKKLLFHYSIVGAFLLLMFTNSLAQEEIRSLKRMRFSYTAAEGLGFEEGITRRDPSDVIEVNNLYYVWYTRTTQGVSGYDATVWYATSEDGHAWQEQGEALGRGPKGAPSNGLRVGYAGYSEYTFSGDFVRGEAIGELAKAPVPATAALLALGLAGIGAARHKRTAA